MSDKVTLTDGVLTLHLKGRGEFRGRGRRRVADIVAENRHVTVWWQDRRSELATERGRARWKRYYRAWKRAKRPVPWHEYLNARYFYDTYGPL